MAEDDGGGTTGHDSLHTPHFLPQLFQTLRKILLKTKLRTRIKTFSSLYCGMSKENSLFLLVGILECRWSQAQELPDLVEELQLGMLAWCAVNTMQLHQLVDQQPKNIQPIVSSVCSTETSKFDENKSRRVEVRQHDEQSTINHTGQSAEG